MGDTAAMIFGGETQAEKEQKKLAKMQKQEAAAALREKITGIQGDIGSRTRDLIRRYGVKGGSGSSPLAA